MARNGWLVAAVVVLVAGGARAQALASDRPVLDEGATVRVTLADEARHVGRVLTATDAELHLLAADGQVLQLPLEGVQSLEVRGRRVVAGAVTGGVAGGLAGAGFTAFLCAVLNDDSSRQPNIPVCAAAGGLVGGALGAGVGALVGLALPRWKDVWARRDAAARLEGVEVVPTEPVREDDVSPIGELTLLASHAHRIDGARTAGERGPGGRLQLLAHLGRHLAVGPELAYYAVPDTTLRYVFDGQPYTADLPRSLRHVGGVVRLGTGAGTVRPAVVAGLLAADDGSSSFLALTAGGEVELRLGPGLPALALEARLHENLQTLDVGQDPRWVSAGAGVRFAW